jgi:hypothetical protein
LLRLLHGLIDLDDVIFGEVEDIIAAKEDVIHEPSEERIALGPLGDAETGGKRALNHSDEPYGTGHKRSYSMGVSMDA